MRRTHAESRRAQKTRATQSTNRGSRWRHRFRLSNEPMDEMPNAALDSMQQSTSPMARCAIDASRQVTKSEHPQTPAAVIQSILAPQALCRQESMTNGLKCSGERPAERPVGRKNPPGAVDPFTGPTRIVPGRRRTNSRMQREKPRPGATLTRSRDAVRGYFGTCAGPGWSMY
jgi:hypothetical protein